MSTERTNQKVETLICDFFITLEYPFKIVNDRMEFPCPVCGKERAYLYTPKLSLKCYQGFWRCMNKQTGCTTKAKHGQNLVGLIAAIKNVPVNAALFKYIVDFKCKTSAKLNLNVLKEFEPEHEHIRTASQYHRDLKPSIQELLD